MFIPAFNGTAEGTTGFNRIGSWTPETQLIPCNVCGCTPVYNTQRNTIPEYKPDPVYSKMSSGLQTLLILFFVVSLVTVLAFTGILIYYRKKRIVKATQPAMLFFILLGSVFACMKVIIGSLELTDSVCIADRWLGHIAFFMVFGALSVKTWRVHMIVNSSMRRMKISSRNVIYIIFGLIISLLIYLAVFTSLGSPYVLLKIRDDGAQKQTFLYSCDDHIPAFSYSLYGVEALLIISGGYFCYSTRNVPDAVNDSKNIASAVYIIILLCCLITPIVFFLNLEPTVSSFLVGMSFAIATVSANVSLFTAKVFLLFEGADLDTKLNLIRPKKDGEKKEEGNSNPKVATDDSTQELLIDSTLPTKKIISGMKHEAKIDLCHQQLSRWQQFLLQLENKGLVTGSGASSGSRLASSSPSSSVGGGVSEIKAMISNRENARSEKLESRRESIQKLESIHEFEDQNSDHEHEV